MFCKEHGITWVDLPTDSHLKLLSGYALADPSRLARTLADAGISVRSVSNSRDCQLILGPHGQETDGVRPGPAAAKRRHGMAKAMEAVQLAGRLGARSVQLWLGCPSYARWFTWPGSEVSWDDNLRDLAAALGEVHAGLPPGVRISLEPHPKQVVYDAETMRQLLDMAGFDIG